MLFLRVVFALFLITGTGNFPQDEGARFKELQESRYYIGIGIMFDKVPEDYFGEFISAGRTFSNKDGELSGRIIIIQVFKNGPAYRAGLKSGDVIDEVDGISVIKISAEEFMKIVNSKDEESMILLVGRIKGHPARGFAVDLMLEKIDRLIFEREIQKNKNK